MVDITVPYGVDWDDFYKGVLGPYRASAANQMRLLTSDSATAQNFSFADLANQFGSRPSDTPIQDAMKPEGMGGAGLLDGIADWFPRIAVIVLGFIFVAAGLSMFKVPVVVQTVAKVKEAV